MHLRTLLCAVLLALLACSGSPARTASAGTATQGPSSASAPVPDDLARLWPFGDTASIRARANLGGLLHTAAGQGLLGSVLGSPEAMAHPAATENARKALDAIGDVVLGANEQEGQLLVIARIDDRTFDVAAFLASLGARPRKVAWAKEVYEVAGWVVVHEPGLVLIGTFETLVAGALARRSSAPSCPSDLALTPGEYLTVHVDGDTRGHVDLDHPTHVEGTVLVSKDRLRLRVTADASATLADSSRRELRAMQTTGVVPMLTSRQSALVRRLLPSLGLESGAGRLAWTLDLRESPPDQARDLGALGLVGWQLYLTGGKAAEARSSLQQIANDCASLWNRDDPDATSGSPRKLVSFPAVPAQVPRGVKYASSPADWAAWRPLEFSLDSPQYFQYEVVAAKDGESAEVIARGDLNGDGKTSLYRILIAIDRASGKVAVPSTIDETDWEE